MTSVAAAASVSDSDSIRGAKPPTELIVAARHMGRRAHLLVASRLTMSATDVRDAATRSCTSSGAPSALKNDGGPAAGAASSGASS